MPKRLKSFFRNFYTLILIGFFVFTYTAIKVRAVYYPTDNITNPTCAPGDSGCYVSLVPNQTGNTGKFLTTNGTNLSWADVISGADLNAFSGVGPINFNNTNGQISINQSSSVTNGYLSSVDWNTFNNKQNVITVGTSSQYLKGDLSLGTFPTNLSSFTNDLGLISSGSNNNVGFGTNSPSGRLHVISNGVQPGAIFQSGVFVSSPWGPIVEFRDYLGVMKSKVLPDGSFSIQGHYIGRGGGNIDSNFAMGSQALGFNSTGGQNTAIGFNALGGLTTGSYNVGIGFEALALTEGSYNIAIGTQAMSQAWDTISNNIAIGVSANFYGSSGGGNISIGSNTSNYIDGSDSVVIGTNSGDSGAMNGGVTIVGGQTRTIFGSNNTVIGYRNYNGSSLYGSNNTIIGANISSNLSTDNNILIADGSGNIRIFANSSGNVGIGTTTPVYRLSVGNSSVNGIVARFQNLSGACDINPTSTSLACTSDITLKKNIKLISNNQYFILDSNSIHNSELSIIEKFSKISPVRFNWNQELDTDALHAGFIAQNVEMVFPDLVSVDASTNLKSVNYLGFVPYIVAGVNDINIQLNQLKNLDLGTENSLGFLINKFLSNSVNRIQSIFVREANIEKAKIEQLCLGDDIDSVCITKEDLKKLLENKTVNVLENNSNITTEESEIINSSENESDITEVILDNTKNFTESSN